MASKQRSGYDCSFVNPLPKDVQSDCSICLQVLREPYLVGCCGYRFCRACIEPIQSSGRKCPLCNGKFTSLPDRQLQRILNDKMVYCTNKGSGCTWRGKLANLESHFAQSCTFNLVLCSYCKKHEDTASKLESQHYDQCPMYPVLCPHGCGSKPFRKNLPKHVDENCPMVVVDCVFKFAGCDVQLPRREMKSHEDTLEHLVVAAVRISELETEIAELKEELKAAKKTKPSSVMNFKGAGKIQHLRVTNLPPNVNKQMLKCVFGQNGSVEDIEMNVFGADSAKVVYKDQDSALLCLSRSEERGINLKSIRLCIVPEY